MVAFLFLSALLIVVVPFAMWFSTAPSARDRWLPHVVGTESVGRGQFREAVVPRLRADGPPGVVRAAAVGSWALGAMFIPGLGAGLFGLLLMGLGLVSVPGLILAARLFLLGAPLLRAEPEAAVKARALARFARVLNYVVLGLCGVAVATMVPDVMRRGFRGDAPGFLALVLAVVTYAGLSLGHAWLLVRSAEAIEAQHAPSDAALSGLRIAATTGDLPAEEAPAELTQEERDARTR